MSEQFTAADAERFRTHHLAETSRLTREVLELRALNERLRAALLKLAYEPGGVLCWCYTRVCTNQPNCKAAREALADAPAPVAHPPAEAKEKSRKMLVEIEVSADFEKRVDNQWMVEREINDDRWSWRWAGSLEDTCAKAQADVAKLREAILVIRNSCTITNDLGLVQTCDEALSSIATPR